VGRTLSYFRFCDSLILNSSRGIRMTFGISAVVLSLSLMAAPAVLAQDAMQLDIDFKNSLSLGLHAQETRYEGGHDFQGRHQGRYREGRRAEKGRRRSPVEAIARR
jgi:hypothetical protein